MARRARSSPLFLWFSISFGLFAFLCFLHCGKDASFLLTVEVFLLTVRLFTFGGVSKNTSTVSKKEASLPQCKKNKKRTKPNFRKGGGSRKQKRPNLMYGRGEP